MTTYLSSSGVGSDGESGRALEDKAVVAISKSFVSFYPSFRADKEEGDALDSLAIGLEAERSQVASLGRVRDGVSNADTDSSLVLIVLVVDGLNGLGDEQLLGLSERQITSAVANVALALDAKKGVEDTGDDRTDETTQNGTTNGESGCGLAFLDLDNVPLRLYLRGGSGGGKANDGRNDDGVKLHVGG